MTMTIAAIVLAAGGSSRLGRPKQLLRDATGETLVHSAAREAIEAGAHPVIVVIGAEAAQLREAVVNLDVHIVENAEWRTGLASSIHAGVRTLVELDQTAAAALLLTCDMPAVGAEHLRALAKVFEKGAIRVASAYGNTRGIPAIIRRQEFGELLMLTGDKGAKSLVMRGDTEVVTLANGTFDLDTPEDVTVWQTSSP